MRIANSLFPLLLFWAIVCSNSVQLTAQVWPAFRHDNARSGSVDAQLDASRLELQWTWQSEVPPQPAWDGPAQWDAYNLIRDLPAMRQYDACFHPVSDGKLLFFGSSSQDTLTALEIDGGSKAWSYVAGGPIRLAPTVHNDFVLFGCDDGFAYCLNRKTGELIWKFNPSNHSSAIQRRLINNDRLISFFPIRTGITVRDGVAYFGASFLPWNESFLCAVDVETGGMNSELDTYVTSHSSMTLEGSLLVADDNLIVPQGRVAPLMFNRSNGEALGSLAGGGGVTIVLTEEGDIVRAEGGRDARSGQVGVFQGRERVASFPRGRAMVVTDDRFFVIDGQKLFSAERESNELFWSCEVDEPLEIILAGEHLFVGGRDHVTAIDVNSGDAVWSSPAEGRVFGLAVAGGSLIASTDAGAVHAFAPTASAEWSSIQESTGDDWVSPPVAPVRERNLVHRWVFHRSAMSTGNGAVDGTTVMSVEVRDQAGDTGLDLTGTAKMIRVGDADSVEAIELDQSYFPIDKPTAESLPTQEISIEAWVRVDQPLTWGGIAGYLQDDGSIERGWILGFRDDKFCFGVAGGRNGLTYMNATDAFMPGAWNHVVGTYDSDEMRLYVNGSLAASSREQSGPLFCEGNLHFAIGAYKDENELYPLQGALHEVRIYATALDAPTISRSFRARANDFKGAVLAAPAATEDFVETGPYVRFTAPGTAEVTYTTLENCPTVLELITEGNIERFAESNSTQQHKVTLSDLPLRRDLQFQILDRDSTDSSRSENYAIDTHFDWTQTRGETSEEIANLIANSPNPRGLAFVMGVENRERAETLARESEFNVVLAVGSETVAKAIRNEIQNDETLFYGNDLSVIVAPVEELPAVSASVVISSKNDDFVRRLVRPEGGVLSDGNSVVWKRDALKGSGQWTHMYGRADNSAFGGEHLSDVSNREDLMTQWIGRPGPRYQTDRQNRKPSPLAAGGRLFLQGQQRMIALDSYSGTVLWSVESPTVMRWNVPHDCSNWCADDDGVYVAAEDKAWFIDGRNGEVKREFELPGEPDNHHWGFISRFNDQLIGSSVRTDAIYYDWWGPSKWFDSTGGDDTHVVAGEQLFSLDHQSGAQQWTYDGLVLHPTITIMDGSIYFVEDKTSAHIESENRRIAVANGQQYELVCLDSKSGEVKWKNALDSFTGHVSCIYLAGGGEEELRRLVLVASESTTGEFDVRTFNPVSGGTQWQRTVEWETNHHGKHISRPAIQGELLYLRPEVMNLADGETIHRGFPGGHGCSSYTLSTNGLFSRLGETTWWDVRNEKVNRFDRIRTDCWISVVPAQGMILSAEGGGGCSCGTWLETSLGFLPRSVDEELPEE
ncbi:MAG: PQQ-binding-like beta-propeller repeat protein [Planctomycetota bacterium]